jgi:hypothetical protein
MHIRMQLLALEHSWRISAGSCLTTLLTALISLRATTTCLPTWRTGWNHSASATMRNWCKVSKLGWARWQQTSLTQMYKNLFPDMISASIPAVTMLRSRLSMYVYFVYNYFFPACFVNSSPKNNFWIALVISHTKSMNGTRVSFKAIYLVRSIQSVQVEQNDRKCTWIVWLCCLPCLMPRRISWCTVLRGIWSSW